ncbi:hypothetical protein BGZ98_000481 [Dissophora globulifera]|nr:hypothetical protein BGZ98_000481 [Dissophora globulifera]
MPDYSSVLKSINARDDSLFTGPTAKAMFTHSKNYKRCILLAEGFYEWRRRGKERVPFYTKRRDGKLMLMAAIYDVANLQGLKEPLFTYATITTNASPQLDWLHDRMPVLLPNHDLEKIGAWLDPNTTWNATLEAMLKPYDEFVEIEDPVAEGGVGSSSTRRVYALETYQVDEKVNSVRNDAPDFTTPWNATSNKKTLNRFFTVKSSRGDDESTKELVQQEDTDSEQQRRVNQELKGDIGPNSCEWEREQEEVSVLADDALRDAGFDEQDVINSTSTSSASHVKDLGNGLELSQQDLDIKSEQDMTKKSSSPRSVDILEKRRQEQQREDEEMKKVLELSMLEAIADGHVDFGDVADPPVFPDLDVKREQEELETAIAASLSGTNRQPKTPLSLQMEQPTTSSSALASSASELQGPKKTPASPADSPRKRKLTTSAPPSPAKPSKKGKPSQDTKITSFFQHVGPR